MAINDLLKDFLQTLLSDPEAALAYSEDPTGSLVAAGITDQDLQMVDLSQTVSDVSNELNMAPDLSSSLTQISTPAAHGAAPAAASAPAASAPASAPAYTPPPPAPTIQDVEQTINEYVTVVYEGDEVITNNFVDNSQTFDIDADGDYGGDIDIHNDVTNVNALGDGSVAAGGDAEGIATGDGALAVGDSVHDSQLNTGDGAVQIDGSNSAPINTGTNTGIIADGDVDDTIIGDGNTQVGDVHDGNVALDGSEITDVGSAENVISGDGNELVDVDTGGGDAVVGDGNQTVQGEDNSAAFGGGDVTDFGDAHFGDGAQVATSGGAIQDNDVTNTSTVSDSFNDESVETTTQHVDDSEHNVDLEVDIAVEDSGNYVDVHEEVYVEEEVYTETTTYAEEAHVDVDPMIEEVHVEEVMDMD